MAANRDVELAQQPPAHSAGRDARRRLSCGRPLEDITCVVAIVLEYSCEIGMARPRPSHRARARRPPSTSRADRLHRAWAVRLRGVLGEHLVFRARRGIHDVLPVRPVAVSNVHRDRGPERLAGADAGEELHGIVLDLHAPAAAVALLPSRQFGVDVGGQERHAGGHPFEDADERGAV